MKRSHTNLFLVTLLMLTESTAFAWRYEAGSYIAGGGAALFSYGLFLLGANESSRDSDERYSCRANDEACRNDQYRDDLHQAQRTVAYGAGILTIGLIIMKTDSKGKSKSSDIQTPSMDTHQLALGITAYPPQLNLGLNF